MFKKSDTGVACLAQQTTFAAGIVAVIYVQAAYTFFLLFWQSTADCAKAALRFVHIFILSNSHFLVRFKRCRKALVWVALRPNASVGRYFFWVLAAPFFYLRASLFGIPLAPLFELGTVTKRTKISTPLGFITAFDKIFERFFAFASVAGAHVFLLMCPMAYHTAMGE